MSLEEVSEALAKCYMEFYSHKVQEIFDLEEGFKKEYLMSAMRLMMKEQCSAFKMTGMKMPDMSQFANVKGFLTELHGS